MTPSADLPTWIDDTSQASLTPAGERLYQKAKQYIPELCTAALSFEKAKRVSSEWADRLAQDGFYRAWTPQIYGGLELSPLEMMRIIELLAIADASVSWCVFIGTTSSTALAGIDPDTAREMAEDPHAKFAGVFAPMGKATATNSKRDEWLVQGNWRFGSGIHNADWMLAGCLFYDEANTAIDSGTSPTPKPKQHMVFVPRKTVKVTAEWDAMGLMGSGSCDFAIDSEVVSNNCVVGGNRNWFLRTPLYRYPVFTILGMGFGAIALGIASGAIGDITASVSSQSKDGKLNKEVLRTLALHEAKIRAARGFYHKTITDSWDALTGKSKLTVNHRRDIRMAVLNSVDVAQQALNALYPLGGSASFRDPSHLQRRMRDLLVIRQHIMVKDNLWPLIGELGVNSEVHPSVAQPI